MSVVYKIFEIIIVAIATAYFIYLFSKKQIKDDCVNEFVFLYEKCLEQIKQAMKNLEANFSKTNPNPYDKSRFLSGQCDNFNFRKNEIKRKYYILSKKERASFNKLGDLFEQLASVNLFSLKNKQDYEREIKEPFEEMEIVLNSLRGYKND